MTARCLFVCTTLLLFANGADGGGVYQHTRDRRTLIWNNYPTRDDEATWSGERDSNGYATGYGTLTWYRVQRAIVTGSNIPSAKGRTVGAVVINRYSGKMVRGRFDGPVVNVDASGKMFHGRFVNGTKANDWVAGPLPRTDQPLNERVSKGAVNAQPPAEGPPRFAAAASIRPFTPAPSAPATSAPATSIPAPSIPAPSTPPAVEPEVKSRMITDFKEQTQAVLSRVSDATGNFPEIDRLDSVQQLPPPVSESVASLVDRARDFRAKVGYETALSECRSETETVDALSAVDQSTRNIAGNNASAANSGLTDFLKDNPEPMVDTQRPLWRYLTSMRLLCSRLEKEAETHLERAGAFASAGRTGDAIREYKEAYRTFPNPATAEKIRQLQRNSLGL
ncbi:MAG: hypothetical protein DME28_04955 [Verrucomicrobia bacterium]|nr:MAG: hypothetical protein DME28_04955 [Verrucomicrobiota bacterium]